jgi:hypothetical protein
MTNNIVKAVVAKVQIGHIEIDGLMMPDGSFGIAVPQIAELFLDNHNQASQTLKRLVAGHTQILFQVKTKFNRATTNAVTLQDFIFIVHQLALSGNEKARVFWNEYEPSLALKPSSKKRGKTQQGYIYLFEGGNALKLGFTANVQQRLKTLSRWDGELELILYRKGSITVEQNIHRHLHRTGDFLGDEWYPLSRKFEIMQILDTSTKAMDHIG